MSEFTDAEQAFIDATVPVLKIGEEMRALSEAYEVATDVAGKTGEEQLGERATDIAYIHKLMLAAAEQAGFDADSPCQEALRRGYEEYVSMLEMVAAASDQHGTASWS